ncbi:MAG: hypothetical protein NTZ46_09725 [Verrucomicrobia bacterium]|nr:hypothetical protein [Verrucomicrobiota bacterium]
MSSYKVVVLDCPYDTWSKTSTQSLFSEIINLKLAGYTSVYTDGVLPVDTYDFIATHILVCGEENGQLKPLTGFKSVTLSRCKRFNLPFPTSQLLSGTNTPQHTEAVASIMRSCDESGDVLAYDSSWTVHPLVRKDRPVHHFLQELFISNVVHLHTSAAPHKLLGAGVRQVRTDKFFERVGFKRLSNSGEPLSTFKQASLVGAEVALIHLERFSEFATSIAQKYESFWNERVVIQAA